MARRCPPVQEASGVEKTTTTTTSLTGLLRGGTAGVRLQHLFLSPLVVLTIPSAALYNQNIALTVLVASAGLAGMLLARQRLANFASITLLALLIWGKAAGTLLKTSSPDTAVLIIQFTAVIILMEASSVLLTFNRDITRLRARNDELSQVLHARLQAWLGNQLANQAKLGLLALGLSILLLPIAGVTSIQSNQLVLSATLALLAVVVLLFLTTYRREPEAEL